ICAHFRVLFHLANQIVNIGWMKKFVHVERKRVATLDVLRIDVAEFHLRRNPVVCADLRTRPFVADESDLSPWIGKLCNDLRGPVDGESRAAHSRPWIIPSSALADNNLIERRVVIAEPRADEFL